VGRAPEWEEVGEGMSGDSAVPEAEEGCGRTRAEGGAGAGPGGRQFVMSSPDAVDDVGAVGGKCKPGVKGETEVDEGGDFSDGMNPGGGEILPDGPGDIGAGTALGRGLKECHDFGFGEGQVEAIALTPRLSSLHLPQEGGRAIGNEAKIIDIEEDGQGVEVQGVGEADVGELALEEVNEIGHVKAPELGGEAPPLSEAF
jgi:hypothetical protein